MVLTADNIVKPVLSGQSKKKTNYRLMQVKRIAEFSKGSILQSFRPSLSYSTLDKQRIRVNTQLKSSKKQLKINVCLPKSNSNNRYAITCDVIAYHLAHFVSIRLINKCQSGIDFIFTSERAIYSSFMKISVPSPVFRGKTLR